VGRVLGNGECEAAKKNESASENENEEERENSIRIQKKEASENPRGNPRERLKQKRMRVCDC